jgi:hypothetical protein
VPHSVAPRIPSGLVGSPWHSPGTETAPSANWIFRPGLLQSICGHVSWWKSANWARRRLGPRSSVQTLCLAAKGRPSRTDSSGQPRFANSNSENASSSAQPKCPEFSNLRFPNSERIDGSLRCPNSTARELRFNSQAGTNTKKAAVLARRLRHHARLRPAARRRTRKAVRPLLSQSAASNRDWQGPSCPGIRP